MLRPKNKPLLFGNLQKKLSTMLSLSVLTITLSLFSFSNALAQGSGRTISCPQACKGLCFFTIDIIKTNPDANGCFNASVKFILGSTNPKCTADVDREFNGNGKIEYTLCDAAGTKCEVSPKNFPPNSPFPYKPGSHPNALSKACYDAVKAKGIPTPGTNPRGFSYDFTKIKDIKADFTMNILCFCGTDTIKDTIAYETPKVIDIVQDTDTVTERGDNDRGDNEKPPTSEGDQKSTKSFFKEATTIYNTTNYDIESIYPNPVDDQFNVRIQIDQDEEFQFTIVDDLGQWIQNDVIDLHSGENDVPIQLKTELESGKIYYLLIHRASGTFSTTRLLAK